MPLKPPPAPEDEPPHHPGPLWLRPTIRIRLTLLYGGMFLMAGVILLVILYVLAAHTLKEGTPEFRIVGSNVRVSNVDCPALPTSGTVGDLNAALTGCVENQRALALSQFFNRSLLALLGLTIVAFAFG
ncbi:two-component sensor histidine kinase, partial [Streptomyces sp. RS10V-4]|nr:two-component sensor histidine kinase [Streptomyces rhizoryzae]